MSTKISPSFGAYYQIDRAKLKKMETIALHNVLKMSGNGDAVSLNLWAQSVNPKVVLDVFDNKTAQVEKLLKSAGIDYNALGKFDIKF